MDNQTKEGLKQMSDMVYEIYDNFIEKGISPIVAGKMAIDLTDIIFKMSPKDNTTGMTISDIWGIYGGKAD